LVWCCAPSAKPWSAFATSSCPLLKAERHILRQRAVREPLESRPRAVREPLESRQRAVSQPLESR
jgi:hypothetical protein